MAQVKVFGSKTSLDAMKAELSDIIHECLSLTFGLPKDKRFQRFFRLAPEDFVYPEGRSERYTIVEVSLFEGRSVEAKKAFIRALYERTGARLGLSANDLEITLFETPRHNWGIRGVPGDELTLDYAVRV
jgi:phenylpyruvate tautomerase PptA (4-oxalocrotonate tautomerase family)